eukprot:TRINITY_DN48602_c0_g1_i1.p1 TRINITY_DN48602_c0_g1~~TRINITY_DN48602_c0_g1_i1.p1  ORF type:complete len:186 (-),score=24.59 TRINITY_DN48602_c0_g1_i1:605-1162(-)
MAQRSRNLCPPRELCKSFNCSNKRQRSFKFRTVALWCSLTIISLNSLDSGSFKFLGSRSFANLTGLSACPVYGANTQGRLLGRRQAYRGPVQEHIEDAIKSKLRPAMLEVSNESRHGLADESHFHVLIVSDIFEGKTILERHRLVQSLFMKDNSLEFHSLRITARTPEQWQSDASVPGKPTCRGH